VKISNDGPPRQVTFPDYVQEGFRKSVPPDRPSTLTLQSVVNNADPFKPAPGFRTIRDTIEAFETMKSTRSMITGK
jgi:hypothetical protein